MIFCIFDLETTGLVIGQARIIEAACILYDGEIHQTIEEWATLIHSNEYGNFDTVEENSAFAVNGINKIALTRHGMNPKEAFQKINRYFDRCDYVLAHNGINFDKPLLEFEAAQMGVKISDKQWVDSRDDIEYPSKHYSKRLSHLAADFNIPTYDSHRALSDCRTLAKLLVHFDLKAAVERSKSPLIKIIGEITYKENEKREEAKKRRFMWDAQNKQWYKLIREMDFDKENDITSFMIRKVPYDKTT